MYELGAVFVGQPSTHVDWLHLSHPGSVQVRTSVHAGVHVRNNNGSGSKSWKKQNWVGLGIKQININE